MHQKMNVLVFFEVYVQKGSFEKKRKENSTFTILSSFLVIIFSFFPQKIPSNFDFNMSFLTWPLAWFYKSTSFASPTAKSIGPCQWIM